MTNGGYFNHYDDPDEFWDEAPLEPASNSASRAPLPMRNTAPSNNTPVSDFKSRDIGSTENDVAGAGAGGDTVADALRFHAYMRETRRLLNLMAEPEPRTVTGSDRTTSVTVSLGVNTEFIEIYIDSRWQTRLDPSQLRHAVIEAANDAARVRAAAASSTDNHTEILARLRGLAPDDFPATPIASTLAPADTSAAAGGRWRNSILDLARSISDSPAVGQDIVGDSAQAHGRGSVTLTPHGALADCAIDALWAAGQSGGTIAAAVNEAIRAAARESTARTDATNPLERANRLIAEAIAFLDNNAR
ncbi:YbaB/EbfC family nucleoid-associated protein [Nocardia harenae]|uniref:YbaB/EbfC family nucleoid-associated protein n=1 Tax=Nocardia harenae TaxID=358707 RepID=UPI000A69CF78|nr:YbaB/EbfC family nucleoid-associated protein [Nocardia harenae]